MNTQIPDGLPTLDRGSHRPHDGSACVMEYVSLLAGEQWTDSPLCTHALIAGAARGINDGMPDDQRGGLLVLVPRLLTANTSRYASTVADHLLIAARRYAERKGYRATLFMYAENPVGLFTEVCGREAKIGRGVEFLTFLLDEFDEFVGKQEPAQVTDEQYATATKAISADVNPVTRFLTSATVKATFY